MIHGWNRRLRGPVARRRLARPDCERLEPRCVLAADSTPPVFAVLSDGLADTYAVSPEMDGASSWIELLAGEQRASFGARATPPVAAWGAYRTQGYEYVWSVPTPVPAVALDQLQSVVDADAVDYVVVSFAQHALASRASEILAGAWSDATLDQWLGQVVDQSVQAADQILTSGRAQVVLTAFDDPTLTPAFRAAFPSPTVQQRLHAAAQSANARLFAAADARYLPVVDLRPLAAYAWAASPPRVGDLPLDVSVPPLTASSADDLFVDGLRFGTLPSGLVANAYLEAIRSAYDETVEPLSDQRLRTLAGLPAASDTPPTYFDVTPLVHFDSLPVARNDTVVVRERVPTIIPLLANDVDPEGQPLVLRRVTPPQHGSILSTADGRLLYQSEIGYEGVDWFWYEVSDGRDRTSRARIDVEIVNAPPVIRAFDLPAFAVPGQPLEATVRFTDAGTTDEHVARWQWGDGSATDGSITKTDGSGYVNDVKSFSAPGAYRVGLTVVDDSGGVATRDKQVAVRQVMIGTWFGRANTLLVGGTPGDDLIQIRQTGTKSITVRIGARDVATYPLANVSAIAVYGQAGKDIITLENVKVPALLDGGADNDYLLGGAAGDVLIGGDGDDTLYGGAGQNVIIGGEGSDSVVGNRGEDLLVGGATTHDRRASNLTGLLAEWSRTDLNYEGRVANLRVGGGRNGVFVLNSATVRSDSKSNKLQGGEGRDWYFTQLARPGALVDQLLGRIATEWVDAG